MDLPDIACNAFLQGGRRTPRKGLYSGHFTTTDGARLVMASKRDARDGDENMQDQLLIEVGAP